ncbi:MAG: hypothetical protein PHO07_11840 [Pirellulales bacterium]|nr:hypothetical protein [Thermoguttaceae bacterium]MDD4787857.1 hypothetical protein [Pirellulales bacterium]MDI9444731.1 hypothetical protein [Planctomycetota bacterium]NLY99098.1 hypothetical protein [Pirellulaceae bacterium]
MTTTTSVELGIDGLVPSTERAVGLLLRSALLVWVALLGCAAFLLIWRRAAGAFSCPLPAAGLALLGLVAAFAAAAVRLAWRALPAGRGGGLISGAVTVSLVSAAIAVSLPKSPLVGILLLWAPVLAEEAWAWRPSSLRENSAGRSGVAGPARPAAPPSAAGWTIQTPPEANVTQQLTRLRQPDGTERIQGWLRTAFGAGQRLASVHVAFCPPLAGGPEADLKQLAGPDVRIKKVQVFPFGARFDLKLAVPAEMPLEALFQFTAEAPGETPGNAAAGARPEAGAGGG